MPILDPVTLMELPPCPKHKRYQGKGKPRTDCQHCKELYMKMHPDAAFDRGSFSESDGGNSV